MATLAQTALVFAAISKRACKTLVPPYMTGDRTKHRPYAVVTKLQIRLNSSGFPESAVHSAGSAGCMVVKTHMSPLYFRIAP